MKKEDLMKFCCPYLKTLREPWTHDGFTYATDGRVLIRIPEKKSIRANPNAPTNGVIKYFKKSPSPKKWYPLPDVKNGGGLTQIGGIYYANHLLYLIRSVIPNAQIGPVPPKNKGECATDYRPALIKFKGGDGLLMPVKR